LADKYINNEDALRRAASKNYDGEEIEIARIGDILNNPNSQEAIFKILEDHVGKSRLMVNTDELSADA
jgi:hypothetical protein